MEKSSFNQISCYTTFVYIEFWIVASVWHFLWLILDGRSHWIKENVMPVWINCKNIDLLSPCKPIWLDEKCQIIITGWLKQLDLE